MNQIELSQRIADFRKEKGLSQKELGKMLGVSNKAVSKWENGESMPKTSTLVKMAELMNIDANALIGLELQAEPEDKAQGREFDILKSENDALRKRLDSIEKRKRKTFIIISVVILAGIVCSGILAYFFSGDTARINSKIKNAGAQNTKIVFNDITFVPVNSLEKYVVESDETDFSDTKYADFYNGKEKSKIAINCNENSNYILLKTGLKRSYYIKDSKKRLTISRNTVNNIAMYRGSISNYVERYDEIDSKYKHIWFEQSPKDVFLDFYENRGEPVGEKAVELYLGQDAYTIQVIWYEEYTDNFNFNTDIGETFKDNDGNAYFYDYTNGKAYMLTEEMKKLVYNE